MEITWKNETVWEIWQGQHKGAVKSYWEDSALLALGKETDLVVQGIVAIFKEFVKFMQ